MYCLCVCFCVALVGNFKNFLNNSYNQLIYDRNRIFLVNIVFSQFLAFLEIVMYSFHFKMPIIQLQI